MSDSASRPDQAAVRRRSAVAAWLGWLFDGLDMHLFTLVASPFVAELLAVPASDPSVRYHNGIIQAGFLVGWAFGGAFFGLLGDRLGRSRTLVLTILCYTIFTGLAFFATAWWHLLIFRFLAALGIGGEWAVGASLLAESWPARARPWLAAILQSGVNIGILLAGVAFYLLADFPQRYVFLVGLLPALLVLWIRKAVPETEEWQAAAADTSRPQPRVADLFAPGLRGTTWPVIVVCASALTAHWAFMFWWPQHLRSVPGVRELSAAEQSHFVGTVLMLNMLASIAGNFLSAAIARKAGYRRTLGGMCVVYAAVTIGCYVLPWPYLGLAGGIVLAGVPSGLFALFTMYLPPLFPTLLRTTGAGFCYNIGRLASAAGTLAFGLSAATLDFRTALCVTGFLFLPAAAATWLLPEGDATLPNPEPSPTE